MEYILTIKDFKAFENRPIKLKPLTVLAGSNSVGKSTIIQSLLISRFAYQEHLRFGSIINKNLPINGPFLLELGNTTEVVRRGKKVSESKFYFTLECNGQEKMKLVLNGDISSQDNYHITVLDAKFDAVGVNFLQDRFYYLSAERIGPRLKYEYEVQSFPHTGYKGENTFQHLFGENSNVEPKRLFRKKEAPPLLFDQVREWLDYVIPGAKFDNANPLGRSKVIQGTYGDSLPPNVGFGISYVLPVIVNGLMAKQGSTFIVENPEAHLHPSGQSRIGRFLAQIASDNVNVIIETHSEHVLNGIRLAVLEGDKIGPNDTIVNFISIVDSKVHIDEINMNETAEFNDYPPGFIDQEQRDIAEMVRIKKAKNAKS